MSGSWPAFDARTDARPRPVRFRLTPTQQAGYAVVMAVPVIAWTLGSDFGLVLWQNVVLACSLPIGFAYLTFFTGTTLTPEGVRLHGLRRRTIRWADIEGIEVVRRLGGRSIVIHHDQDQRTLLDAPGTVFFARDLRFDEKAALIEQYWLGRRGIAWTPRPRFVTRCRWSTPANRPRIRPAQTQAWPIALALACLCSEVVLAAIIAKSGDLHPTVLKALAATPALLVLGTAIWQFGRHGGVTLTPDHLDVHNLRHRRLRWNDVADVSVRRTWSGSRIVIRELTGRQTRLSSPRVGLLLWDRDFADKAWAVHHAWQSAIAAPADERTADALGFLQAGGTGEPRYWKKVVVGVACVALCYELVVFALVSVLMAAFGSGSGSDLGSGSGPGS